VIATAATFGVATYLFAPSRITLVGGVFLAVALVDPSLAVATAAIGVFVLGLYRIRRSRTSVGHSREDGLLAVELVALGVTAGLPFRNAVALTADQIEGPIGDEIMRALRRLGAGYESTIDSSDLRSVFSVATAAEASGMPIAAALNALATDRKRAAAAVAREKLSKLPVKMLFPLAFLILPGFVMLTVVPPLLSGLSRLGI
jgi:Flp pilus assembly protein TadB